MARRYIEQTGLKWPLLLDDQRVLYRAYQMERADWWSIYGPASIWHYLKLIVGRGRRNCGSKNWRTPSRRSRSTESHSRQPGGSEVARVGAIHVAWVHAREHLLQDLASVSVAQVARTQAVGGIAPS